MEKEDARKLSPAEQHERHRQVIRAYKRGLTRAQIGAHVGLSHPAVSRIVVRYEAEGMSGLSPRKRGRRHGENRALSAEQEVQIWQLIGDKRPEQLKMDFALWSRAAVMLLIERECGVQLHVRTVGKYLKRWGFTPQKPIKRAYEQSPAAVRTWLDETYPAIAERAKAEGGEIHWGDETALVNTDYAGAVMRPRARRQWQWPSAAHVRSCR